MRRTESGFNVVELLVIIVLLGILVATALPHIVNIDEKKQTAVADGVLGGFQNGVSLYHAQWLADGRPAANTPIPEFNNLRSNASGYPYGLRDNGSTGSAVASSDDCAAVFTGTLKASAPSVSAVAAIANVVDSGTEYTTVRNGANCDYYYTGGGSASGSTVTLLTYVSSTGTVDQTTAELP